MANFEPNLDKCYFKVVVTSFRPIDSAVFKHFMLKSSLETFKVIPNKLFLRKLITDLENLKYSLSLYTNFDAMFSFKVMIKGYICLLF